ncbi:MAG: Maf family protein [Angelakisella sp.]|nr:Maf family protein [Angelakisella sp.]
MNSQLILASGSPRRRELLSVITQDFKVVVSDAEEYIAPGTPPWQAVEQLAEQKAQAVFASNPQSVVIGSDTVVALGEDILGKPADEADAKRMLACLSGKRHTVYTGVAVLGPNVRRVFHCATAVEFYPLTQEEIAWYVSTGEPMDKAGAYGIQGQGSLLVKGIQGDYFNVMGFPVAEVARALWSSGIVAKY